MVTTTTTRVHAVPPLEAAAPAPAAAAAAAPPPPPPPPSGILHFAVRCVHPKGEDTVAIARRAWPDGPRAPDGDGAACAPASPPPPPPNFDGEAHPLTDAHYALFAVYDGHNGRAAAAFCEAHVADAVHAALPAGRPPRGALDGRCGCPDCRADAADDSDDDNQENEADEAACAWRAGLQRAVAAAVAAAHAAWASRGAPGGTTATLVLAAGRLLTVANVGDTAAYVDTGAPALLRLTADHRVASSRAEAARVRAAGGRVAAVCAATGSGPASTPDGAGLGPLRAWGPDGRGGLANARAVGDLDVRGALTTAAPAIAQVLLPPDGGRLLLASDGVWDAVEPKRAARAARAHGPPEAAEAVVAAVLRAAGPGGTPRDDATIVVVDVLPSGAAPSFPETLGRRLRRSASRGAALAALAAASGDGGSGVDGCGETPGCQSPGGGLMSGYVDAEEAATPPPPPPPRRRRGFAAIKAAFAKKPPLPPAPAAASPPPVGGAGVSVRGGSSGRGGSGFLAELARSVRGGSAFFDSVAGARAAARPTVLARVDVAAALGGRGGGCGWASDDASSDDGGGAASCARLRNAAWLAGDAALVARLRGALVEGGWGEGGAPTSAAAVAAALIGGG